jgi:hypothetical protein
MRRSVLTTNEQMDDSIVLVFTGNDEAPVSEWVKRVRDRDFACQNSGIMNCLPIAAVSAPPLCTRSSVQPSSTDWIRNSISERCLHGSLIIPSARSRIFCPGSWHPHCTPTLQKPLRHTQQVSTKKISGHLPAHSKGPIKEGNFVRLRFRNVFLQAPLLV